jgi:hypothetical protein
MSPRAYSACDLPSALAGAGDTQTAAAVLKHSATATKPILTALTLPPFPRSHGSMSALPVLGEPAAAAGGSSQAKTLGEVLLRGYRTA